MRKREKKGLNFLKIGSSSQSQELCSSLFVPTLRVQVLG